MWTNTSARVNFLPPHPGHRVLVASYPCCHYYVLTADCPVFSTNESMHLLKENICAANLSVKVKEIAI